MEVSASSPGDAGFEKFWSGPSSPSAVGFLDVFIRRTIAMGIRNERFRVDLSGSFQKIFGVFRA
jgi:hypothetical protein